MSLELLLSPKKIEKKPQLIFLFSILAATIAILLSIRIFPSHASIVMITFTILPLIPLMVKFIEIEEYSYEHTKHPLRRHNLLKIYCFIFLGLVVGFSFWYTFLPTGVTEGLFSEQLNTISSGRFQAQKANYISPYCVEPIPEGVTGCSITDFGGDSEYEYVLYTNFNDRPSHILSLEDGNVEEFDSFFFRYVLFNNLQLLLMVFLTSFIFGAGAIFIIAWNASLVGIFIGETVHKMLAMFPMFYYARVPAYFAALPLSLGSILLHGIPEFLGFFMAALSGGVISVAMIRHRFMDAHFRLVMKDALLLFFIAVALVLVAAYIEVLV